MKKEVRTMPYQKNYSTSHTTQLSVKGKFKSALVLKDDTQNLGTSALRL